MRLIIPLLLCVTFHCVLAKSNVRSVADAGQEVIEIGVPVKGLPSDLEEEPSAENDEEDETTKTSTTLSAATKKEAKKTTTLLTTTIGDSRRRNKDVDVSAVVTEDDEEARIEKELAEIYKDNTDYKDSTEIKKPEVKSANAIEPEPKPIGRSRTNFQFQPDLNNKAEVERFRTSIDEISCDKRQKLIAAGNPGTEPSPKGKPNTASTPLVNIINFLVFVSLTYCL